MTLRPLLAAPALIQQHALCAIAAFALGATQLAPTRIMGQVVFGSVPQQP